MRRYVLLTGSNELSLRRLVLTLSIPEKLSITLRPRSALAPLSALFGVPSVQRRLSQFGRNGLDSLDP